MDTKEYFPEYEVMRAIFKAAIKREPYTYQRQYLRNQSKRIIINKSRQVGMSAAAALKSLCHALAGQKVMVVSASDRQVGWFMDHVRVFLNALEGLEFQTTKGTLVTKIVKKEENKTRIVFDNGGQLQAVPNSSSTARGFAADHIVLDEFAHFLNNTDREVWEAVLPSASRGGSIDVISTPFGESNEYYKFWNADDMTWSKQLIHYTECPDLKVEEFKDTMDEASFAQEYCNAFLGEMDSYFPYALIKQCIDPDLPLDDVSVQHLGIDFGRKYDLTAIIGIRRQYGLSVQDIQRLEIRLVQTMRNKPFHEQMEVIRQVLKRPEVERASMDQGGIGMPLVEQLGYDYSAKVEPVTFTMESKQAMMTNLKRLMEQRKIWIPDNTPLINSLHAIRLKQTENKNFIFDSPRDEEIGHSDLAWALALAAKDAGNAHVDMRAY